MANSTYFLDKPAVQHLTTQICVAQKQVDFSKQNLVSGDTADAVVLPANAVLLAVGIRTDTVNAGATAQLALTDNAGNALLATAVLGAANSVRVSSFLTTQNFASENSVRMAGSIANFTNAIVTIIAVYAQITQPS